MRDKIFCTVYKVAKNQFFNNYEDKINVQELNGINMGYVLHHTKPASTLFVTQVVKLKITW